MNKIGVINEPLGQTHSPTVMIIIFTRRLFCFAIYWKEGTDVRTEICVKIMITSGRVCGSAEWIRKHDEKFFPLTLTMSILHFLSEYSSLLLVKTFLYKA